MMSNTLKYPDCLFYENDTFLDSENKIQYINEQYKMSLFNKYKGTIYLLN